MRRIITLIYCDECATLHTAEQQIDYLDEGDTCLYGTSLQDAAENKEITTLKLEPCADCYNKLADECYESLVAEGYHDER